MNHTKIDWADMTWNPVTGCLHGCEYCYARSMAKRFADLHGTGVKHELDEKWVRPETGARDARVIPYPFEFDPTFHRYRLREPKIYKDPRNIFVCSMADLFGDWVPLTWIRDVFDACMEAPRHNYLFLTKDPARYASLDEMALLPRESNFWYGATVTNEEQAKTAINAFDELPVGIQTFLSVEPLMEDVAETEAWKTMLNEKAPFVGWVIVGPETGNRTGRVEPPREWVEKIARDCAAAKVPLFMKSKLEPVWGELVQEWPGGLEHE